MVFERELLGDGDTIVADNGAAPFLLDEHALRLWAERDAHRVGQRHDAVR
jgi:hypothetical protein